MCDTLCALPGSPGGSAFFAKNSDRSPNEPHLVIHKPEARYAGGESVKVTYLSIPQAEHTLETVLCKPSWTWGAEMGINSAAVAIGNEAVFTKARRGPEALTGMDLVRLALERAESAEKAVTVITELLEKYGQGGNCGFDHEFYYDNSFLIVDPLEAYVVETSGKKWVASNVDSHRAISNRLTIRGEHTLRGGVDAGFDFTGKLTEPVYTHFSGSHKRLGASTSALSRSVDEASLMAALRSHDPRDEATVFTRGSVRSVCMHAGGLVGDHTTGSLVARLRKDSPSTLWVTGSSTPCLAVFKPVFFGVPSGAPVFEEETEAEAYWLRRETLHRAMLAGEVDAAALRAQRDALENKWLKEEQKLFASGTPDHEALSQFARACSLQEQELIDQYAPKELPRMLGRSRFARYWNAKNDALGRKRQN